MRKRLPLIFFTLLTLFALPQMSRAQAEVRLSTLVINFWPEYDREEMLVIYKVILPENTAPVELTFQIPTGAGKPYKIAVEYDDGLLYEQKEFKYHEGGVGGKWSEVTFTASTSTIQFEYYDPGLVRQGKDRRFDFTWPGDYAVDSAAIIVQQPLDASDMQFTQEATTSIGEGNLPNYGVKIGKLEKGQTYDFSLSYQKSTDTLTEEKLKVHPAGDLPQSMWIRGLPWALGVLALLLIGGGVFVYWRLGLPEPGEKKRRRRKAAVKAVTEEAVEESGVFCHRCGRRAALSDVFCRSCGTKLRL
jgi:hypothetical protein